MACKICGRSSCSEPFHSAGEQRRFEKIQNLDKSELLDYIVDLFSQGCYRNDTKKYNHSCITIYEDVQKLLIDLNYIEESDCELT